MHGETTKISEGLNLK